MYKMRNLSIKKEKNIYNFKRVLTDRIFILSVTIILFAVIVHLITGIFLSRANIFTMLTSIISSSIIVLGVSIALISGCFDLSVGSTYAFGGVVTAMLLARGIPIPISIIAGILAGALVGLVNGFIVGIIGVDPLIVTIGTMFIVRGLDYILPGGAMITNFPKPFLQIAQYQILGLPSSVYIALFLVIVFGILLMKNKFFKRAYLVGGNEKAAELVGINARFFKIFIFVLSGSLAAFAGILAASRFSVAFNALGAATPLEVTAGAVIGGISIRGGRGTIFGAFLGVVFVTMIYSILVILGIDVYWGRFFIGAMLILSIILDRFFIQRST